LSISRSKSSFHVAGKELDGPNMMYLSDPWRSMEESYGKNPGYVRDTSLGKPVGTAVVCVLDYIHSVLLDLICYSCFLLQVPKFKGCQREKSVECHAKADRRPGLLICWESHAVA
jgi:hypothetical protein